MKAAAIVLVLLSLSAGGGRSGSPRPIAPVCDTLMRLKDLMPAGHLEKRDTSLFWRASGELYRADLWGCLFPVKDGLPVLVQQHGSVSAEMGLVYSDIFVLEGTTRTSTAYPMSTGYVAEQVGDTTFIDFHYLYRKEYDVRLAYHGHRLTVITHEARP